MIVLDTNVLSALMLPSPTAVVLSWLDQQPRESVWTTAITTFEIRSGLESMATGQRQASLKRKFEKLLDEMGHRVLPFDDAASEQAAELQATRKKTGTAVDYRDTMIAGIVLARQATLATRNTRHFADLAVRLVDPWTA